MLDHPWKSWSKNEKHHLKTTLQSNVKVDLALSVLLVMIFTTQEVITFEFPQQILLTLQFKIET